MNHKSEIYADATPPEDMETSHLGGPIMAATIELQAGLPVQEDIVGRYEIEGWVKELPTLHDLVQDTTRLNTFEYVPDTVAGNGRDPDPGEATVTMSEHDGLVALDSFLASAAGELLTDSDGQDLSRLAAELRERLNFVGEKEYQEGVAGTKALWQSYLDDDPDLQLCVYNGISRHDDSGQRKSDEYLIERVFDQFSEDELALYGGRIVTDVRDITRSPEHTKIIIVDDWTMSGSQIHAAEFGIREALNNSAYDKTIEVNLLAASEDRLKYGMGVRLSGDDRLLLPVKAYYKARTIVYDHDLLDFNDTPITGSHSSGDYGFEHVLEALVEAKSRRGEQVDLPPLANIVRTYRNRDGDIHYHEGGDEEEENPFYDDLY